MIVWKNNDLKLFIILIPIINLINYLITYSNITLNSYFFLTLFIDTFQGYLTWLITRYIIIKAEKNYPLIRFSFKRLFLQLFLTCIAGLAFIISTTEILNALTKNKPVPLIFYQLDIWIYCIWILVVNSIYIGMYYYFSWKNSEINFQKNNKLKTNGFNVKVGTKNIKIALSEINGFFVEDGLTYIIVNDSKSYIIDSSLDSLELKLPIELFFRVNRKFILHRNSIISFKRIENNKLLILTQVEIVLLPNEVFISRLKAPSFKKWFEQDVL
jgi:hypothetical protein